VTFTLQARSRRRQWALLAVAFILIALTAAGALARDTRLVTAGRPEDTGVVVIKKVVVDNAADTTPFSGTIVKARGNQLLDAFTGLVQGPGLVYAGLANGVYDIDETESTLIGYWKADGQADCPAGPSGAPNQNKAVISDVVKVVTVCVYNRLNAQAAGDETEQDNNEGIDSQDEGLDEEGNTEVDDIEAQDDEDAGDEEDGGEVQVNAEDEDGGDQGDGSEVQDDEDAGDEEDGGEVQVNVGIEDGGSEIEDDAEIEDGNDEEDGLEIQVDAEDEDGGDEGDGSEIIDDVLGTSVSVDGDDEAQDDGGELLVLIIESPAPAPVTPAIEVVAAEVRAGAVDNPLPPSTGSGLESAGSSFRMVLALAGLLLVAASGVLMAADRRARA